MADVYLALMREPNGTEKLAVMKRLRDSSDMELSAMFFDEARLSARLKHPNIVHTYEVGEANGESFIAMEYLEGQPLSEVFTQLKSRSQVLSEQRVASIASQVLKGLHYAHEFRDLDGTPLRVVHRDVSPHNLFLTYSGQAKLLDFGIAKALLNANRTGTGIIKGKIAYMAPERADLKAVDRRADLYSLGVVLWEMLAQEQLFTGDMSSVVNQIRHRDPPDCVRYGRSSRPRWRRSCSRRCSAIRIRDTGRPMRCAWRWTASFAARRRTAGRISRV